MAAFFLEKPRADAWALRGGGFHARPPGPALGPLFVEETLASVGRGHEPDRRVGVGGDHRAEGVIQIVWYAGGFVNQEQRDIREPADGGLAAGEADNARAVGQGERNGIVSIAARVDAESAEERAGLADELSRLAGRG